jgi:hypothetical protein
LPKNKGYDVFGQIDSIPALFVAYSVETGWPKLSPRSATSRTGECCRRTIVTRISGLAGNYREANDSVLAAQVIDSSDYSPKQPERFR